jgi:hypothetical protein
MSELKPHLLDAKRRPGGSHNMHLQSMRFTAEIIGLSAFSLARVPVTNSEGFGEEQQGIWEKSKVK